MALRPWAFHELRFVHADAGGRLLGPCALCGEDVVLSLRDARPALRLGLSAVDPGVVPTDRAEAAADGLEQLGGGAEFIDLLASDSAALGELDAHERLALAMALDEDAEIEALEREWRAAEEIAAIMDGELTSVPGFEAFRRSVLEETTEGGL
jgi:hypothetical protein